MFQPGSKKLFVEFGDGRVYVTELKLNSKGEFAEAEVVEAEKMGCEVFPVRWFRIK